VHHQQTRSNARLSLGAASQQQRLGPKVTPGTSVRGAFLCHRNVRYNYCMRAALLSIFIATLGFLHLSQQAPVGVPTAPPQVAAATSPFPHTLPATTTRQAIVHSSGPSTASLRVREPRRVAAISSSPGIVLGASTPQPGTYITQDQLTTQLQIATNNLRSLIYQNVSAPNSVMATGGYTNEIAASNKIDQLSGTKLTSITVNGVSGLTTGDIPSLSALYLPVSGGGTIAGAITIPYLTATSSTASSFAGSLGIGTTSPSDVFAVNGPIYLANVTPAATTNRLYSNAGSLYWAGSLIGGGSVGNWSTDGTNVWRATGSVGIGTTSPFAALSVNGNGYFTGNVNVGGINTASNLFSHANLNPTTNLTPSFYVWPIQQ
jgi:hypothetical protein